MKKHLSLILSGLTILVMAFILQVNDNTADTLMDKPLIEEFDLTGLTELTIRTRAGDVVHAKKSTTELGEVQWVLSDLDNYPVKVQELSKFVQMLNDTRIIEAKTNVAAKHERLGLTSLNADTSTATQLELINDTKTLTLLLGNFAKSSGGRYIRFANEDQTWLVNNALSTPTSATSWIDKKLFTEFTMLDIQRIEKKGDEGFLLSKAEQAEVGFTLQNVPENATAKSNDELASFASSLAGLRMNAPALYQADFWQHDLANQFSIHLFNGLEFAINLKQADDKFWLSAMASGTDEASKLAAADFNQNFAKWQYQIASYSFDSLNKTIADMLVDTTTAEE